MQLYDDGSEVKLAFATPIYKQVVPQSASLNQSLRKLILAKRGAGGGSSRSNVGGWQSSYDFMSWGDPAIQTISAHLQEAFGAVMEKELGHRAFDCRLSVTAWANVNENGNFNRHHTHANNHWSAVYYVDLGEADESYPANGAIEFIDPRPAVGVFEVEPSLSVSTWTIQPEPGLLLMFPSWLRHGVLPFYGKGTRISVAFNLRAREFRLLQGPGATSAGSHGTWRPLRRSGCGRSRRS